MRAMEFELSGFNNFMWHCVEVLCAELYRIARNGVVILIFKRTGDGRMRE